ncbi:Pimeloyl-ACP methyl ester carboxylesterase [Pedobacter westerhofensis]|uniref:Pimeloyl-ACP methyl ester carboxylesterase n=1 Tax=Pedobacter westerhofensis TaxID=425512 RepID=A0A521DTY8_9SPHI|nr:alpha/beta hydrolase [Pedobacter westerhofensis]SMO75095.1 Pimeloyl-ACP methyl ester carboxylesterase [Pedobacter westerhofensis]
MNTVKNKTRNVIGLFSMIGLILMSVIIFPSCSKDDDANMEDGKAPVVLVHGAWQASYAWEEVKTNLTAQGYQVIAVNLKGHGNDNTPVSELSFSGYVDQVKAAIDSFNEPVILIGHSLGGAVITQAATQVPAKIAKLVYVAGFIPQTGKSVLDYAGLDRASLLGPVLEFNADQTLAGVANPDINFLKVFIQDGTDKQKQFVLDRYRAEPVIPLATPLNYTTENYTAAGKKYYVFTTEDNAISYPFQKQMAADAGITKTFTINTGHSPFISKPTELTSLLEIIAKD